MRYESPKTTKHAAALVAGKKGNAYVLASATFTYALKLPTSFLTCTRSPSNKLRVPASMAVIKLISLGRPGGDTG